MTVTIEPVTPGGIRRPGPQPFVSARRAVDAADFGRLRAQDPNYFAWLHHVRPPQAAPDPCG